MPQPLTTPLPARQSRPARLHLSPRTWLLLALALGILARLVRYALHFPFWFDEAALSLNLLHRSYAQLLLPLHHQQVAPLGFLWLQHTLTLVSTSEVTLRAVPLAASIAAVLLFWQLARRVLNPLATTLAVALVACSLTPITLSTEAKPYSLGLLAAVALTLLAVSYLQHPRARTLLLLAIVAPLAVSLSYAALFTAAAVGLALLPAATRQLRSATFAAYTTFALTTAATAGGILYVARAQSAATHTFMQSFWHDAFPPHTPLAFLAWLFKIHAGNMLAYPVGGGVNAFSILIGLAMLAGLIQFLRQHRRQRCAILALLLVPFALTFAAAFFHQYPYGDKARVAQHLLPAIALLAALGTSTAFRRLARILHRPHTAAVATATLTALFALVALISIARDTLHPYRNINDQRARMLAHLVLADAAAPNASSLVYTPISLDDLPPVLTWNLRALGPRLAYASTPGPNAWLLLAEPAATAAAHYPPDTQLYPLTLRGLDAKDHPYTLVAPPD